MTDGSDNHIDLEIGEIPKLKRATSVRWCNNGTASVEYKKESQRYYK